MTSINHIAEALTRQGFSDLLLSWFEREGRSFPWRTDVSAYRVAVAEALLQKTSATNALPVFERFIAKYPTVKALADADGLEVTADLKELGLPRRAQLLHSLSREISANRGGVFPSTESELRRLPGVGPYGAAAIASLAFGARAPMIDINVMRIFERLVKVRATPRNGPSRTQRELLLAIMPKGREADFNLALLDLGALVCKARAPLCEICPLSPICSYNKTKRAERVT